MLPESPGVPDPPPPPGFRDTYITHPRVPLFGLLYLYLSAPRSALSSLCFFLFFFLLFLHCVSFIFVFLGFRPRRSLHLVCPRPPSRLAPTLPNPRTRRTRPQTLSPPSPQTRFLLTPHSSSQAQVCTALSRRRPGTRLRNAHTSQMRASAPSTPSPPAQFQGLVEHFRGRYVRARLSYRWGGARAPQRLPRCYRGAYEAAEATRPLGASLSLFLVAAQVYSPLAVAWHNRRAAWLMHQVVACSGARLSTY